MRSCGCVSIRFNECASFVLEVHPPPLDVCEKIRRVDSIESPEKNTWSEPFSQVCIDRETDWIFVSDHVGHRIQVFQDHKWSRSFGCYGRGNGEFRGPTGISIFGANIMIVDGTNNRIQDFDREFNYVQSIILDHRHQPAAGDTNKTEMKTRIFLPLAGIILLAAGCRTSVNTIENAQKEGQRQMVSDQRVITDASLAKKVSFVGVNQAMTPGGLLKVQIELLNRKRSLQRFSYQFQWFDANGMQINNVASPTIPDQIEGGESKFISSVAPTPACKDFRVKFIEN